MFRTLIVALVWIALLSGPVCLDAAPTVDVRMPEPNPPLIRLAPEIPDEDSFVRYASPTVSPNVEWIYHKTSDNLHPNGDEQKLMWLMNRARSNPSQEGTWLSWLGSGGDHDITIACNNSNWIVDMVVLQNEFAIIPAKPPAAFDVRLYNAAKSHSEYLITNNTQSHTGQSAKVIASGFKGINNFAGIVFSYSLYTLYGHAGFNIDWGYGSDGTQDPPGHRNAIMSVTGDYSNVGYAIVLEDDIYSSVGPQVITGNFYEANTLFPDHYNRFIVGTVWIDLNGNGIYDVNEGIAGVSVMPDSGTFYAVTSDNGGYAIPVDPGNYVLFFSGPLLTNPATKNVSVGQESTLVDFENLQNSTLPFSRTIEPILLSSTSAALRGAINPYDSMIVNYYFEYGITSNFGSTTPVRTINAFGSISENISGLTPDTVYHYRIVAANPLGTSYSSESVFLVQDPLIQSDSGSGGGGGGGCFIAAVTGMDAAGNAVMPLFAMVAALAALGGGSARRNGAVM
jgi:hypothetical protein